MLPFMTKTSSEAAATTESLTAKGLKLEQMITGEKMTAMMKKNPTGPTKGLYHGFLPSYF